MAKPAKTKHSKRPTKRERLLVSIEDELDELFDELLVAGDAAHHPLRTALTRLATQADGIAEQVRAVRAARGGR